MGFGHRVYRAEDPRARALRRTAKAARLSRASGRPQELERAALAALAERKPDRMLATNVEFWSAVILDHAGVPQRLFTPLFACARTAGWSAHILEQRRTGRLVRPAALYVGPGAAAASRPGGRVTGRKPYVATADNTKSAVAGSSSRIGASQRLASSSVQPLRSA